MSKLPIYHPDTILCAHGKTVCALTTYKTAQRVVRCVLTVADHTTCQRFQWSAHSQGLNTCGLNRTTQALERLTERVVDRFSLAQHAMNLRGLRSDLELLVQSPSRWLAVVAQAAEADRMAGRQDRQEAQP